MRRGIRAQRTAQHAKRDSDITDFLISMYQTGVWNEALLTRRFLSETSDTTSKRLTGWLEQLECNSWEEKIDAFSYDELWSHSYAHGYPFQTSVIACRMPYTDNEFYDLYLLADSVVRWSHKFQDAVILRLAPELKRIPISYGHIAVPYGESYRRYAPALYHLGLTRLSTSLHANWLLRFDNSKPFRPYHRWYNSELLSYIREMLFNGSLERTGIINMKGVENLLKHQMSTMADHSRPIHILLTFAHLIEYVHSFQSKS